MACELAQIAERNGISAITIHGRTREEYFSGEVDLDIIKKVKQSVDIPVIGNGNIKDEETAKKMFEYTGVDGIMIGRGAIGNPFIFREIIEYLKTGKEPKRPSNKELLNTMIKHINLEVEEKGEYTGIREMRKNLSYYTKGLANSSAIRDKINKIESKEELINTLIEYFGYEENK